QPRDHQGRLMRPALALLVAGCFGPDLGGAPFKCGARGECPPGYSCAADSVCRKGPGPDPRLGIPDAPPGSPDAAAVPDAQTEIILPTELDDICATPGSTNLVAATGTIETSLCLGGTVVGRSNGLPDLCVRKVIDATVDVGVKVVVKGDRV